MSSYWHDRSLRGLFLVKLQISSDFSNFLNFAYFKTEFSKFVKFSKLFFSKMTNFFKSKQFFSIQNCKRVKTPKSKMLFIFSNCVLIHKVSHWLVNKNPIQDLKYSTLSVQCTYTSDQ